MNNFVLKAGLAIVCALLVPVAAFPQEGVSRNALAVDLLTVSGANGVAAAQPLPDAPLIVLTPEATAPALAGAATGAAPLISLVAQVPGVVVDPAAPGAVPAPMINLGAAITDTTPLADIGKLDGTATLAALPAAPFVPPPVPPAEWLMPLLSVPGVIPAGVHMGAGMSQPGIVRLTGEITDVEFRVILPAGAAPTLPLFLAVRSSVNNLPEASEIAVRVNGADSGKITLDNNGPFAQHRIDAKGLVPGVNLIRLTARQSHRIFCGPEASFGIWTEIDMGQSGIPVDAVLLPLDPTGLIASLQSQGAGNRTIEVLADETTNPALIVAVARSLGDALGFVPRLSVLPFYSDKMDTAAKARIALIPGPNSLATIRRGAGEAMVLQIEYAGDTLPDLTALLPAIRAASIPALTPGAKTPISDLGVTQVLANTRYFRRDVPFTLPDDWLLLASQKAEFEINYGFAANLPVGGLMLFKVNGQTVRLLPLDENGGRVQPPLRISFLANMLHSGVNTLTFEGTVPGDPADMPCLARDTDMLVILGESAITVPRTPRMSQSDLARSLALLDGADVTVPLGGATSDPTLARDALIAFESRFRPLMAAHSRPRLHVVGLDGLGMIPLGQTDVSRRDLQDAVSWRAAPAAGTEVVLAAASDPFAAQTAGAEPFRLSMLDVETDRIQKAQVPEDSSWFGWVSGFFAPGGWMSDQADVFHAAAFPGAVSLSTWISENQGRALLLQVDASAPDDLWLLAGPDVVMADLVQQLDTFRRDGANGKAAQAAMLRPDGTWATWSHNPSPRLLETLSLGNLRDVAGNYASWRPGLFTSLSLLFALLSVMPALVFVLMSRRAGSRT